MLSKLNKSLIGGSLVLLITINIFNALNYFFHFAMARLLTVAEYSTLAALYSIIYILGVFSESLQTVISKYSTQEKDNGRLKDILKKTLKKGTRVSLILFFIFLFIGIFVSIYLKIDYLLVALTGIIIFSMFLVPILRGAMQGRKRFKILGFNLIAESSIKFMLSIFLVLLGWKVYGAIIGTLIGAFLAFFISFINLRDIFSSQQKKAETPGIYGYTAPVFSVILAISLFYSLDVILARIFFTPEISGYYAMASTLSKIIFFGTQPISKAMFPISSDHENHKDSKNILFSAILILGFGIVAALLVFYLFPDMLVRVFSGKSIAETSSILIFPAIAISFLSFANLTLLYKLSKARIKRHWLLFVFIAIEITLLSLFNNNLTQYSIAYAVSSVIFFIGSLFLKQEK